jgi:hypothetical protein
MTRKQQAEELTRMAAKLLKDARAWRKVSQPCGYTDGVLRGLHEAASACRRRARQIGKDA